MKKSTMSAIAAVSTAGVIALGLGAVTDWYKNWNAKSWFNYWGKGAPVVQPVDPDTPDEPSKPDTPKEPIKDNGNAVLTDGESNGITVMSAMLPRSAYSANGISEQSDTAYTLTATITPENADVTAVDWSVAWKNPASSWASGKTVTDYVTVTATSDGALTANLECKQAFGEQVIVTVTYRHDVNIKATTTADYRERLTGASYFVNIDGTNHSISNGKVFPYSANANGSVDLQKSDGTISGNYESTVNVFFSDDFVTAVTNWDNNSDFCGTFVGTKTIGNEQVGTANGKFSFVAFLEDTLRDIAFTNIPYGDYHAEWALSDLMSYIKNTYTGNIFKFDVTAKDTVTGKTVNSIYNVTLNKSDMIVYASSLALGNGVVF